MNKAPGLPLTVGLMGELVKNKEVGRWWQLRGLKGLLWTHLLRGLIQVTGFPVFVAGSMGGTG